MSESLILETTAMAYGGAAIAHHEQRVVFIPYALAGEQVRVTVTETHKRWMRAELLEVLRPSPDRIEPVCPHFGPGRCGGCQWQHAHIDAQYRYKQQLIHNQFTQKAGLDPAQVQDTRPTAGPWAYVSHATYFPAANRVLGLPSLQSERIHPIDTCPLQYPDLSLLYKQFQLGWDGLQEVTMTVGVSSGQRLVVLRTVDDQAPEIETDMPVSVALQRRNNTILPLIGEPWVFELIHGHEYRISAGSARPTHPWLASTLIEQVANDLQPAPGQTMLDVYCGFGLFSRGFADYVSLIIGMDDDAQAIEDCAFNCRHLDNVSLAEGPPPQILRLHKGYAELAVVSPPATGMGHRVAQNLARLGVRRAAYVAPHPNTLLRDLPQWQKANYVLHSITPLDMGPQTAGALAVALFVR